MDINCTDEELFILKKIADAAAALQMPAYIIGGFVRDKILDRPDKDLDIVCTGLERMKLVNTVCWANDFGNQ